MSFDCTFHFRIFPKFFCCRPRFCRCSLFTEKPVAITCFLFFLFCFLRLLCWFVFIFGTIGHKVSSSSSLYITITKKQRSSNNSQNRRRLLKPILRGYPKETSGQPKNPCITMCPVWTLKKRSG